MTSTDFVLAPYPGLPFLEGVRITGTVRREGALLQLDWRLEGPEGALEIPTAARHPERRRELWERTCFEFFLASPDRRGYWEFNLAPSGHWNVYRFEGYRAGMADELAFEALPFTVASPGGGCAVSAGIDTARLGLGADPWHLGVSTVVAESTGRVTFWALAHPAARPDFHQREAFRVRLTLT